jgi:hypothetical protein
MLKACQELQKLWLRALAGEFDDAAADRKPRRSATIEYAPPVADQRLLQSTI